MLWIAHRSYDQLCRAPSVWRPRRIRHRRDIKTKNLPPFAHDHPLYKPFDLVNGPDLGAELPVRTMLLFNMVKIVLVDDVEVS